MLRPILIGILFAAILAGCSSTTLLYNNAPWLILSKIDDYFPLSGSQQQQLKKNIGSLFEWHRQQELVEYSALLKQFNQQFLGGLTAQELTLFFDQLSAALIRFAEASIPSASQFLSTVSDEQIDAFDRGFREKLTEKAEKLNLSPDEAREESFDDFVETLEDWFGDFDEAQLTKLRTLSDARPHNRHYWFDKRQQRHEQFLTLLRDRPGEAKIAEYLHGRYVVLTKTDAEEAAISLEGRNYWRNTMLSIDQLITPKQRQNLIAQITDYSADFLALSQQSNKPVRSAFER
jgi:hypothetical protein